MDRTSKLEELRQLFLSAPESNATRVVAVLGSLSLLATVLWLVRRGRLREEFTPIWIAISAAVTLVCLRPEILNAITRLVGAWTQSATIFFLGEVCLVVVCLSFSVRLSRAGLQIKNLAQEIALLRGELDRLQRR